MRCCCSTRSPGDPGNVELGRYLNQRTPPGSRIADFWAGNVFYFADRHAVDLLGKSDPVIARLHAVSDGRLPGHNKFDFDHSLGGLRPDYLVSWWKEPVSDEEMGELTSGDYAFRGRLFFHPLFRQHCLPHPLPADTWRTIYACEWGELGEIRCSVRTEARPFR